MSTLAALPRSRRLRRIPDRPTTNPFDTIHDALTLIRRKAGFLGEVLASEIELTDRGDRSELVELTYQMYTAAEQALAQLPTKGGA